jgi:hypothetical protein
VINKPTKLIYFDGQWWRVVKVFTPTKYDDFILLSCSSNTTVHEDGTIQVDMVLIDAHNNTYYPDTPPVRRALATLGDADKARQRAHDKVDRTLTSAWLAQFSPREYPPIPAEPADEDDPDDY